MASGDGLGALLLGMGFGGFLFFNGLRQWNVKRRIENLPTSSIRSLAMGLCEVQGTVHKALKDTIPSPFSGKPCVYYRYTVEEYRQRGKHSEWVTIKSGEHRDPFFVKDKTGSVLVHPRGATIDIPADNTVQTGSFRSINPLVKKFAAKNKFDLQSFFGFNRSLRFTEYYLAPGDKIFVLGTAGDNPHTEESTAQHGVEDVMIQEKRGNPYYISDKDEKGVLNAFAWKVYGGLFGGGALFIVCLGILLAWAGAL